MYYRCARDHQSVRDHRYVARNIRRNWSYDLKEFKTEWQISTTTNLNFN